MQRRHSRSPTPPPRKSVAELRAERARVEAELAQAEALEAAELERNKTLDGARVIVPDSPSPRKKRASTSEHGRPPSFPFRDSTLAGPPEYTYTDSLRAAQPSSRESLFASHESALPRPSAYAAGLAGITQKAKDSQARKQKATKRATGFSLEGGSSSSVSKRKRKEEEVEEAASSSSKGKGKEVERKSRRSTTSAREGEGKEERSVGGGMSRHAAAPKPKVKPSMPPIAPYRLAAQVASEDDEGQEEEDSDDDLDITDAPAKPNARHADGTLVEELELGPVEHKPIPGDPDFETIEPNSGIHLKKGSRVISHHQMQLHLADRYHLPPSLIYALARKATGSDHIDIDVDADFVVIGVLAWKGETRVSNPNAREEAKERKNLRFTLVDLSTPAASQSGAGTLSVMLFEAQSVDQGVGEDGWEAPRYKGGSGGAYEKFWKESAGAVVAIINPQILKPRVTPGQPNVYTITPRSADSMMVIGRAENLSSCQAMRQDRTRCGDWCDRRVNQFCNYHVQRAVRGNKAARPETANVSSSMSQTATFSRKKFNQGLQTASGKSKPSSSAASDTYDPVKKTGLLPDSRRAQVAEGLTTYISAGTGGGMRSRSGRGVVLPPGAVAGKAAGYLGMESGLAGFKRGVRDGPTEQQLLRERKVKKEEERRAKKEVRGLLGQDRGRSVGGEYVERAARLRREERERVEMLEGEEGAGGKRRTRGRERSESSAGSSGGEGGEEDEEEARRRLKKKKAFSTAAVRLIGYDPTNHKDVEDDETKRIRLSAISDLTANRPAPKLSAPPGPKIRSGVSAPVASRKSQVVEEKEEEEQLPDLRRRSVRQEEESEEEEDDLVVEGAPEGAAPRVGVVRKLDGRGPAVG